MEHRAPQTRDDPEEPLSVGPSGIRTAGRARGCPLLQSHSAVAARYLVVGGPSIGGVRLQLRDNQPGAPLVDVQLYDEAGEWQVGTGLAGGATLRAYGALPGEVRGVRVQSIDRSGPGDPRATITGLQFLLADGRVIPESCSLFPVKDACDGDGPPANWTRDWWLPTDARFAGLILLSGWPHVQADGDAAHSLHQGTPLLVDIQVLHTCWLVCNPYSDVYAELSWATPDTLIATGPPGILLRTQTNGDHSYGLVDVGIAHAGQAHGMAFGNQDFTGESLVNTRGRTIVGIQAQEVDHHGITNLSFSFSDGSRSRWVGNAADSPAGVKIWSHTVSPGRWAVGLRLRCQHHFGIVDVCLRTNDPWARTGDTMSDVADLPCSTAEQWEWVSDPLCR